MMEPLKRQIKVIFSLGLTALWLTGQAQSFQQEPKPIDNQKPYEINTYMGANGIINLLIMVRQPTRVTLKITNADDEILHELHLKKSPKAYHCKVNFADSQAGQYKLEISDGRTRLTRQIEVVDVPATEAQRYLTFTSPVNQ